MRRFWLQEAPLNEKVLEISGDLFHHIHDVCRFGEGDHFELIGGDRAFEVKVEKQGRRSMRVAVVGERALPPAPHPHVHLALSCPRLAKVDWIVEKSVELGVKGLHLFVSDYSHARALSDVPRAKMERWQKLVQMATQQCGRGDLMQVEPPQLLKDLLPAVNRKPKVLCLFAYEGESQNSLKRHLASVSGPFDEIWLWLGSEGGFSLQEVEQFKQAGIKPVSLGVHTLRVETACLALASVIKYEFQGVENGSVG